jgi:hypothetical protein
VYPQSPDDRLDVFLAYLQIISQVPKTTGVEALECLLGQGESLRRDWPDGSS